MTDSVTLIGTIAGRSIYNEADIIRLLNTPQIHLLHGETFTGKPSTQLYIDTNIVLKVHSEIRLNLSLAKRWAAQALEKEQRYQVYHPNKTWFVIETEVEKHALIGNICPRLQPLHHLLNHVNLNISIGIHYLTQLFDQYFRAAKTMQIRLDEGLSNFGVNDDNQLYYLDDDIYRWDHFISCAQMLGVYFRSLPWLNDAAAAQLGNTMQQLIIKHFDDTQYLTVLAEQVNEICMPLKKQRQIMDNFVKTLNIKQQPSRTNLTKNRYIAVLADVHANLPALNIVLDFLKLKNIQQSIVLGDIVGYGPYPSQCIERLQETGFVILKGNHDHGLATNHFKNGFSRTAAWALEWTKKRVSNDQKNWLANLPSLLRRDRWLALHGAPIDPMFFNAYVYEMTYSDNLNVLQRKNISLCFHGHTHQPGIYGRQKFQEGYFHGKEVDLKLFNYALVCPGSVGQPRNRQPGAQFAIYDQKEHKVYYHNLPYNTEAILQKMEIEGFPTILIDLLKG